MKKILILIFAGTILFNASNFIHPLDFKNSIVEKQKVMEFIVNDVKEIYTKCCLNLGIKQSVDLNIVAVVLLSLFIIILIYNIFKKKDYKNIKINFGKHRGKKYSELSREYLTWIVKNVDKHSLAKREIQRRKTLEDIDNPELTQESKINIKKYGDNYEKKVGKYYENKGYKVDYRGLRLNEEDGGIDIIAIKENETLLIQCKYWKKDKSITHSMIKEFYGNCNFYLDQENIQSKKIICVYVIPSINSLSFSAIQIFKKNYKKCRYNIVE
jgi:Holliday junction resolvase-like predicted endonuclease